MLPYESDNKYVDLNMWEWPACAALFGLGIMASRAGWLTAVPDRLRRRSRTVTLVAVGAAAVFAAAAIALGVVGEQLWGGWYWPALVFAAGESTLSVFGPVWLLGVAQRRLNRSFGGPPGDQPELLRRVHAAGPRLDRTRHRLGATAATGRDESAHRGGWRYRGIVRPRLASGQPSPWGEAHSLADD